MIRIKALTENYLQKFMPTGSSKKFQVSMLVAYLLTVACAILFFSQGGDLNHTVTSSYAYLRGHFFDFYDYNLKEVSGNDYLPSIYLLFAAWMSPLALFGLTTPPGSNLYLSPIELVWAKSLIFLAVLVAAMVLVKISAAAFPDDEGKQKATNLAFATSPFLIFASLQFGQYDILGLIFGLVGVLGFLKKNTRQFVIGFAIAISFKYFALFLFLPLALYYFEKKRHVVVGLFSAGAIALAEMLIYANNPAFVNHTMFSLASGKVGNPLLSRVQVLVGVAYLALCIAAYLAKNFPEYRVQFLIIMSFLAFLPIFLATVWHPQWIVLLIAPFALAIGLMKRPNMFLILEIIGFLIYVIYVTTSFPGNVDGTMIAKGPLSNFAMPHVMFADVVPMVIQKLVKVGMVLFFVSPGLWLIFERLSSRKAFEYKTPSTLIWIPRLLSNAVFFALPALALALL